MLTKEGCLSRQKRFWNQLDPRVEWVVVGDPRHIAYLANFWVQPLSFSAQERSLLVLDRAGKSWLIADNFTRRSAACVPHVDREVLFAWYDHKHSLTPRSQALTHGFQQILPEIGKVGMIEGAVVPAEILIAIQASGREPVTSGVSLNCALLQLRRQKEPDEIEQLRECMRVGEAGLRRVREVARAGVTEWDVYRELHAAVLEAAGKPVQMYGDFRATNASLHKAGGMPTNYRLANEDLLLIDYSVVIDCYRSDFTNTFAIGQPTPAQRKQYDLCLQAMHTAEATLRAGVAAREVYNAVRGVFEAAN